jgi:hypothetical protein
MMTKHINKAMISRVTGSTMTATGGMTKQHGDGNGLHSNGEGRHNNGRHNNGKGQHNNGRYDNGDGRQKQWMTRRWRWATGPLPEGHVKTFVEFQMGERLKVSTHILCGTQR